MRKTVSMYKQEQFENRVVEVLKYLFVGSILLICFIGSAWQW